MLFLGCDPCESGVACLCNAMFGSCTIGDGIGIDTSLRLARPNIPEMLS